MFSFNQIYFTTKKLNLFKKVNTVMVNGMKKQKKIEICLFTLIGMQVLWLVKEAHAKWLI